jgi:hypothetical protein
VAVEITIVNAAAIRKQLQECPGSQAVAVNDTDFLFRWNPILAVFECMDLATDVTWRPAGVGSLIFCDSEGFCLAPQ